MGKDVLGRTVQKEPPEPERRRLLSDDELTTIANDWRTRPPEEVGRHVMPLVAHISVLEDRICDACQFWVGWNQADAHKGECTLRSESGLSAQVVSENGENVTDEHLAVLVTPFDWSCKGWTQRATNACEAQQQIG